jgi:iron complex outermembrane receptor protein
MKMKKQLSTLVLTLLLAVLSFGTIWAQSVTVSGKVTDEKTGEGLPGVNVVVKGTTTGTITDVNGAYTIKASSGAVLVFSYISYESLEMIVENSTTIDVKLKEAIETLNEVVVIGYGTVKKSDATGSVTTVSSKDFNKGAITSAQDLIVGKSAGVVITTAGGAPGSGSTIRIRGGSSLSASNDPLIIIDGVPISNDNVSGSSNFLAFVNPNDIETFTVLKDASATAIYGSRASNGVILITTKKGKVGTQLNVAYDVKTSISTPIEFMDVYSGDEMRKIAYDHADLFGAENFQKLGSSDTNWQKEIFRTSFSHDHNLSLSGAYKTLPYRVSVGYTDQNGILKNTDMQRITGSVSLDPTFFDNSLKVNINAKGMNTNNNFGADGAIGSAVSMDPSQAVKDGTASSDGYFQWANYGASLGTTNPVAQALVIDNKSVVRRGIANAQFNYTSPLLPDLHANLNLATDYTTSDGHNNYPVTIPSNLSGGNGKLNDYDATYTNNLLDFYLNYVKELSSISSKIDVTGGYSWQHFKKESSSYTRGIVDATHPYQKTDSTSSKTENYLVSFFGRLNYTLLDRYLLTFTIRDDGSSRFSEGNRWGLFPSAAFAWKLKDESFLKNVNFVSDAKLRLGWGVTGQQNIVDNDYPSQAKYVGSYVGAYYPINNEYTSTLRPNAYDPNIKWEETTTQNIGIDFGFFNNRISGTFDLYKRVTKDLLEKVTIPSGSNFSNTMITNVGSLENRGYEFSLNLIPISKKDMNLTLGFNLTYNENEITKLLASDDPSFIGILEGGDSYTGSLQVTRVGHAAHAFFMNKQVYDSKGNPIEGVYVDLSGKGGTVSGNNADKYICHSPAPDYTMGFSARFDYKKFDISASSRVSLGNYVYNQVAAGASYDQISQIGYWKNMPTYLSDTKFIKRQFTSDYFVEDASFFKLDNISAGYRFENIYDKLNLRVSFTVQNVLTVTNYSGLDPEVKDGIDNNFYPRPRTYILGLSLGF